MKKITDFIVDKRLFIFILVLGLTILSFFLISKVEVKREIIEYLPDNSKVKIGYDIMEDEFTTNTSTLNIMLENLNSDDKARIYEELTKKSNVKEVLYDSSETYNKDNYTLYIINLNVNKDSNEAKEFYNNIIKEYQDYNIKTSGEVSSLYKTVLPLWIVVLAICCALVILLIMCDSYIEPFLFLLAIGMGVFLNKGTNIIFNNISSITNSITSILQLALSMDYSIMLINRYRQEKEKDKNNVSAMKKALYKSFSSISSSSLTTIVGLLALVFMSFKIGKDLGLVLAKGVLFSLFTIFTCLPFLILSFDKLITKTHKKAPNIKLNKLGNFAFKHSKLGIVCFLIIFITSLFLKGNLNILYTDIDSDDVAKHFNLNNQMAIVYKKDYEDKLAKYSKELEKDEKITDVLGYGNTINEPLLYQNINSKLTSLKSDTTIKEYLLKIIYYKYYNKEIPNMTFNDFLTFLKNDVYNNPDLESHITNDIKENVSKLEQFTNLNNIYKLRNASDISSMLGIDINKTNELLIYYNSLTSNNTLTIKQFLDFTNNYLLKSEYKNNLSNDQIAKLNTLNKFANTNILQKELSVEDMASLFSMDKQSVKGIYDLNKSLKAPTTKMTINTFANFINTKLINNKEYQALIAKEKDKLNLLNTFSQTDFINQKLNYEKMSQIFNLDKDLVFKLYSETTNNENITMTIKDFVNNITILKNNHLITEDISNLENIPPILLNSDKEFDSKTLSTTLNLDETLITNLYKLIYFYNNQDKILLSPYEFVTKTKDIVNNPSLTLIYQIMDSSLRCQEYLSSELAKMLELDETTVSNIYTLYVIEKDNTLLTPLSFTQVILNQQENPLLKNSLNKETLKNVELINTIMKSVINNTSYTSNSLANLLGIDKNNMQLLYSLNKINYQGQKINLTYQDFITFLLNDVVTKEEYQNEFKSEEITKIKTINKIINNTINNVTYTKDELIAIIKILDKSIDDNLIDLLYTYYGSNNDYNENWTLTLEQFINYLNDDILKDSRFDDFIDDDMKEKIIDAKTTITDAKNELIGNNYGRIVLNTKYDLENKESLDFIDKIYQDLDVSNTDDIFIVGNTPMAYNLDKTFDSEFNFITILTIIFIFVIVAITFKSFIIPAILVLIIETSVYITMGILSIESGQTYFIAILIVQSILMGSTIDYAILFTSYYLENRQKDNIKNALINSYNNSINTIITSASILSIVTLIIGHLSTDTASKICQTISKGTICSTILIILFLPAFLTIFDKIITKKDKVFKNH